MQKASSVRRRAPKTGMRDIRLRQNARNIKLPQAPAFKAALKLLGPSPIRVAALIWQKGWKELEKLASDAHTWDVAVIAAAVLTLTEGLPGTREFWEDFRDYILGWPMLLRATMENPAVRPRSWERRVEIALYVIKAYREHRSELRMTIEKLVEQREPLAKHRINALQATFIGLPRRATRAVAARSNATAKPAKQYKYVRIRVKKSDGQATTVSLEPELYADVCRAIGRSAVCHIARALASSYNREQESLSLSAAVQQELMAIVREHLQAATVLGVQDPDRFLKADPRPRDRRTDKVSRKPTSQERRKKYGSSYGKTYVTINVGKLPGKSGPTCVSISKALIERVGRVLDRSEINAMVRESAQGYSTSSELSLSEYARERFMLRLCQLPAVNALRI